MLVVLDILTRPTYRYMNKQEKDESTQQQNKLNLNLKWHSIIYRIPKSSYCNKMSSAEDEDKQTNSKTPKKYM